MERFGATGGARSSPTKSERDSTENLIDGGMGAIPPVVARIFSGDSTSPLTREASVLVQSKGQCECESISAHTNVSIVKSEGDSAENLINGGDGEQSPSSRLGIVSEL